MRFLVLALVITAGCAPKVMKEARATPTGVTPTDSVAAELDVAPAPPNVKIDDSSSPRSLPPKVYPRDEFKTAVVGKTQDEIRRVLGKPSGVGEEKGQSYWRYDKVTSADGNTDPAACVWWLDGKAERVTFHLSSSWGKPSDADKRPD